VALLSPAGGIATKTAIWQLGSPPLSEFAAGWLPGSTKQLNLRAKMNNDNGFVRHPRSLDNATFFPKHCSPRSPFLSQARGQESAVCRSRKVSAGPFAIMFQTTAPPN
jgi:hypothetical protein